MRIAQDAGPRSLLPALLTGGAVVAAKVALSLPRLGGQAPLVAITWLTMVAFVAAGVVLLASDVAPVNGWACIVVAAATIPGDLNDPAYAGSGDLTVLGYILELGYLPAAVALVLRYPGHRLRRSGRTLTGLLVVVATVARIPTALTSGRLADGLHQPDGWARAWAPFWHDEVLVRGGNGLCGGLLLAGGGMLLSRAVTAHGLDRLALVPIALLGAVCSIAAAVDRLIWAVDLPVVRQIPAAMVRDLTAATLPVALLAHLMRRRSAGARISDTVLKAAGTGDRIVIRDALRAVLLDPHLEVHIPASGPDAPGSSGPQALPSIAVARRAVVAGDGERLGEVTYDAVRVADDDLLEMALAAVRIGLENVRLTARVRAQLAELEDSRTRIVESGLAERRKLERDLHDGAQQQLLTVAAMLSQAQVVDEAAARRLVLAALARLGHALTELRDLARGIHPAALSQGGLAAAIPGLCTSAPANVLLDLGPDLDGWRAPPTVEGAVYFFVAEALANGIKHAPGATLRVRIARQGGILVASVSDDGPGSAQVRQGGGIAGLFDRVRAVGGDIWLHTDPCPEHPGDRGTTLVARLPVPSGARQ